MLKRILSKLFDNPYKFIKKFNTINLSDNSMLLESSTFKFDGTTKSKIGNNK